MSGVFDGIKHLLKVETTAIDNNIFRLHYKATMFVLVACSLLLTQKHYFGDPIDCFSHGNKVDGELLDVYCWVNEGIYTVPSLLDKEVGKHVAHPGVGRSTPEDRKYHTYYQWVTLFVYLQVSSALIYKYTVPVIHSIDEDKGQILCIYIFFHSHLSRSGRFFLFNHLPHQIY